MPSLNIKFFKDANTKEKIGYISIIGFILSYITIYIRYTYFDGATSMRFPQDIFALQSSLDLISCKTTASKSFDAGKISGVWFVYSPLYVIVYKILSFIPEEPLRWGALLTTLFCYFFSFIYILKSIGGRLLDNTAVIILFISGFFSYGLRFEMDRGQDNCICIFLFLLGVHFSKKSHIATRLLGYSIAILAIHLKVWPVILFPALYNHRVSIKSNVITLGIFIAANFALLFSLGPGFFINYIQALIHANSTSDVWVANLSLHSFKILTLQYLPNIKDSISNSINCFVILYFSTLAYSFFKFKRSDLPAQINLYILGGLLFPSISFDYKLSVLGIGLALLYSGYSFDDRKQDDNEVVINVNRKFSSVLKYNTHRVALYSILLIYPVTLYSYVYKARFGLLVASNTPALLAIGASLMVLLVTSEKRSISSP